MWVETSQQVLKMIALVFFSQAHLE
jgi:hypothetical protein